MWAETSQQRVGERERVCMPQLESFGVLNVDTKIQNDTHAQKTAVSPSRAGSSGRVM